MMERSQALALLKEHVQEENLIQHSLASEAVLTALARRLEQDEQLWAIAGLLHDLDYSTTKDSPATHGNIAADMLKDTLPQDAVDAIRAHNGFENGNPPSTLFDFALRCGETITGFITAAALVRPARLEGMKPKSLKKKMKDKAFARSVNRDTIRECEKIGLELDEFLQLSIDAMKPVASEVGL